MALMLIGSSGPGSGTVHVADSPKARAAAHAVSRIASGLESSAVRGAAHNTSDLDPLAGDPPAGDLLAGTRRILRLIREDKQHLERRAERTNSQRAVVRQSISEPARNNGISGGLNVLRAALAQTGVPYLWGGETPKGFDCSGLILNIARRFGLRLPHSAADQASYGKAVVRDALRPGDLVFFANTYKPGISHVGVYKGGDKFVHASSGRGEVTVGSLKQPYFASRYAGARRLNLGLRQK